jgi:hypothetical protein
VLDFIKDNHPHLGDWQGQVRSIPAQPQAVRIGEDEREISLNEAHHLPVPIFTNQLPEFFLDIQTFQFLDYFARSFCCG